MEEKIILRVIILVVVIFFVIISCGIKGSPLPPKSDVSRLSEPPLVELKNSLL
jgi:hypothetical protein